MNVQYIFWQCLSVPQSPDYKRWGDLGSSIDAGCEVLKKVSELSASSSTRDFQGLGVLEQGHCQLVSNEVGGPLLHYPLAHLCVHPQYMKAGCLVPPSSLPRLRAPSFSLPLREDSRYLS